MGADGGFVAAWQNESDVALQRFDSSGQTLGGPFLVNSYAPERSKWPSIAAADDGSFVVTYTTSNQDGSSWGIFGRRFGADASPIGSEFQVNTHTTDQQLEPSTAPMPDGGFVEFSAIPYEQAETLMTDTIYELSRGGDIDVAEAKSRLDSVELPELLQGQDWPLEDPIRERLRWVVLAPSD